MSREKGSLLGDLRRLITLSLATSMGMGLAACDVRDDTPSKRMEQETQAPEDERDNSGNLVLFYNPATGLYYPHGVTSSPGYKTPEDARSAYFRNNPHVRPIMPPTPKVSKSGGFGGKSQSGSS